MQTLRKERQKAKTEQTQTRLFSKKVLMDKNERERWNLEGTTKGKEDKKKNRKKNKGFEERGFGGTREEKPLTLQEYSPFGGFCCQKQKRQKKTKTPKTKKKRPGHGDTQPPMSGKFLLF